MDIYQFWGGDISAASSGDLMTVDGSARGQQRILRRLLTNPGDYSFHPEYGAGLAQWIGGTVDIPKITALIRGQIQLEDAVAKFPAPIITIQAIADGISCNIKYTDAPTNTAQTLSFNVEV